MHKKTRRIIVFTDLDGTLLNHRDYTFEEARPALARLKKEQIPLIACTSKTRREVEFLRDKLTNDDPFIVENGGGIFFPHDYQRFTIPEALGISVYKSIMLGVPYARIRRFIENIRPTIALEGFGDWGVSELMERTGLSLDAAILAKDREFTEPFLMHNQGQFEELSHAARNEGISITRGGRFLHFIGEGSDKGAAVNIVKSIFAANWKSHVISIGLGDSLNDVSMLRQVDIPVMIPHADGGYEDIALPGLIQAPLPGSRGWNTALTNILDTLYTKGDKHLKTMY
ncbi:MAG: HAD-IIB family hydrolase [Syntrophaceae bacterium]